jgi:23S rRNA pseudouridine1911/1915/1917 synthase
MAVRPAGRRATTRYRTLAARAGIALVELDLVTGRTHQIRVHLKALGHPLIGDPVYGEARWRRLPRSRQGPYRELGRPALHAWRLGLEHPVAGGWREFQAPVPVDLVELWTAVAGAPFPALPG